MKIKLFSISMVISILLSLCINFPVSAGTVAATLLNTDVEYYRGAKYTVPTGWVGGNIFTSSDNVSTKIVNNQGGTNYKGQIIYNDLVCSGNISYTAQVNSFGANDNQIAKVIFYYQDDNNYYYVSVGGNFGSNALSAKVKLFKRVEGKDTQLGSTYTLTKAGSTDDAPTINIDSDGNISVSMRNGLTNFPNIITANDKTFTSGKIGLATDALGYDSANFQVSFRKALVVQLYNLNGYTQDFTNSTENSKWESITSGDGNISIDTSGGVATSSSTTGSSAAFVMDSIPYGQYGSLNQYYLYSVGFKSDGTTADNKTRIIFNYVRTAVSNTYNFIDFYGNGTVIIGKKDASNVETTISTSSINYVTTGEWVNVELAFEPGTSSYYAVYATKAGIRTRLFNRSTSSSNLYKSGAIGFGTVNATSQFKNVGVQYGDLVPIHNDITVGSSDVGNIAEAAGSTATMTVKLRNNTTSTKNGVMLVALMEDGELKAIGDISNFSATSSALTTVTSNFSVPANIKNTAEVKIFLWKDLETIVPFVTK